MAADDSRSTWAIHFTLPPNETHRYTRNLQATVLAVTAERAIETLRAKHPEARVMQVNHKGGGELIVDDVPTVTNARVDELRAMREALERTPHG